MINDPLVSHTFTPLSRLLTRLTALIVRCDLSLLAFYYIHYNSLQRSYRLRLRGRLGDLVQRSRDNC